MYFLPPEVQLDICKCLNYTQLLSVQQTNSYFKNFIGEYKGKLARRKFDHLRFFEVSGSFPYEFVKPDPKLYEFELSEHLEEKWKSAIEKSIPMFCDNDMSDDIGGFELFDRNKMDRYEVNFKLPKYPKTIEEMKIARYFFQQLFKFEIKIANFDFFMFNPKMIQLLFQEEISNTQLIIHSQEVEYSLSRSSHDPLDILTFALNHLISNLLIVHYGFERKIEEKIDILLEILSNGGKKFSTVWCRYVPKFVYNTVMEHLEISKNISKIVKKIKLSQVPGDIILSERAENIEVKVVNNFECKKYQLSNKYNPKLKFFISNEEDRFRGTDVVIERIN